MQLVEKEGLLFYEVDGVPKTLILKGENLLQELESLGKYGVTAISLNRHFCGHRIKDLCFLRDYPFITDVSISNDDFLLNGLYYLKGLERLVVLGGDTLDYSAFPCLRILDTRQPAPFNFPDSLQTLYVWYMKLKGKGLSSIKFPQSLRKLCILWSDIEDLAGLPSGLQHIEVSYNRKFTSLKGLENCAQTLVELDVENCPHLIEYSSLEMCVNVSKLILWKCNTIPSLSFVPHLTKLEHFAFSGTKVLDGDLSHVKDIRHIAFNDHKDYNLRLKDIRKNK